MLMTIQRLSGLAALIAIGALGAVALLLAGFPLVRKLAWAGIALVGVIAAWNELRR